LKAAVWALEALRKSVRPGWRASGLTCFLKGVLNAFRPRGERILSNLAMVYPDRPGAWRKKLRRSLYGHLAWTVTEILALQRDPAQALDWIREVQGLQYLESLQGEKKGALFVSAHYGNWELMASWYAQYLKSGRKSRDFYIVSQNMRDRDLSALVERYRKNTGIKLLPKNTSTLEMVRVLRSGGHIAMLVDISWIGGILLPFMGHECTHATGPAVLSLLASVPVVPISIRREKPFCHVAEFFPPLPVPENGDRLDRIAQVTQSISGAVERMIDLRPELWFWLHNRWKKEKAREL
jgi:KDO2-lipid IV(A) lauroyltransferase